MLRREVLRLLALSAGLAASGAWPLPPHKFFMPFICEDDNPDMVIKMIPDLPEMVRPAPMFTTYLACGDSFTVGLYATIVGSERMGFSQLLRDTLRAAGHAATYEQVAITGSGIDDALTNLPAELTAHHPNLMTVEVGINNEVAPYYLDPPTFQAKYSDLLDLCIADRADMLILCCNVPWTNQSEGQQRYYQALGFNAAIEAEAGARGLPVARCWEASLGHSEYLSSTDSFHFNDDGHAALAAACWAALQPVLATWGA